MGTVESLRQKALTSNSAYLKLLQKYRFNSTELHYIFEGFDDQSFYFNYIQGLSKQYVTYVSYGKKQSIEVYNKIDWNKYDKKRIIIFIDRDYSRLLGDFVPEDSNIYETTYYSIENYISNVEILRRLINEILHYHDSNEIDKIIAKYKVELNRFVKSIKPIISWILIIRNGKLKANLNMIDLGKLYSLDNNLTLIKLNVDRLAYLEKVSNIKTPRVSLSGFKKWSTTIDSLSNYKFYLRGKFEMWFMMVFFSGLNDYLLRTYGHNSKVKTNINQSNAIEILGPRASIPDRLGRFLKNYYP
jgi:hypothetical protein